MQYGKKLIVVELLDKDEVACCNEDVVTYLDECVLVYLYINYEDAFYV